MNCPTCGAEVRVVGKGTLSYEPVAEARIVELEAGIRALLDFGPTQRVGLRRAIERLLERGEG